MENQLSQPGVMIFLPILYVAWADAVLTSSEIKRISKRIDKEKWLSGEEKKLLTSWLNPDDPPSPEVLKSWLEIIKKNSDKVPRGIRQTLAQRGLEMAKISANGDSVDFTTREIATALTDIEKALGVLGEESLADLLKKPDVSKPATEDSIFPTKDLTLLLDGEHHDLIKKVKKILSDPEFSYMEDNNKGSYRETVYKWCQHLATQGIGSLGYPKEFGGGGDLGAYFTAMETLSYHDLSLVIKFGVQFGLFGMSVMFLGTEKHHKKYLPSIGRLELPGCFAMTETGHGSNVRDIETTATYDVVSNHFIINTPNNDARKDYIGNAAVHGQLATVFAQLITHGQSFGVHAFLVPIRDESGATMANVRIEDCGTKLGLNGVDNGRLYFNHVRIPAENLLDRFASIDTDGNYSSPINSDSKRFFTMLGTLVGGRIGIPRAALSASKSALTIAIKYAYKRRQFGAAGQPETRLLDYKSHQNRLMPLLANSYALHFSLQYLTKRFLERKEEDSREIEALAAGLKAWGTWNCTRTIQECREACGGKGYLAENRFAALKADTDIFTTFEGDNTVLMQLVAKSRLIDFKQEFHEINFFGIVSHIASQAATSILEKNPIVTRRTERSHLLDPEFHLSAFTYRERSILSSAARRLKYHLEEGKDSFEAFNECQNHLIQLANAYVELIILQQFQQQLNRIDNSEIQESLTRVYNLFALSQIENNKGWYLESDYIEGTKSKAIRRVLNELYLEVRKDAIPLVNAFDIPETLLAAPIAITIN